MKLLLFTMAVVFSSFAHAQFERFDALKLYKQMRQFKNNPPKTHLVVVGETNDPKKKEFLEYYIQHLMPRFEEMSNDYLRYRALHILVDARLNRSARERRQWAGKGGEYEQAINKANQWTVDEEWTKILKTWAEKAEGLSGKIPDLARKMAHERDLESFSSDRKAQLDEAARLEKDYMIAINEVPAAANVREYRGRSAEIRRQVKSGEISFADGQKKMFDLVQVMGSHFVGYQAVQKAGENLNKMAALRSELAKSKGLTTWAAYALELSGQGYTPEYRGPANQRAFLEKYIAALRPLRQAFIDQRIRELGLEAQKAGLRQNHILMLALPGTEQLQRYFPADKIPGIWEDVMLESGFKPSDLAQINIDIRPRKGKNPTAAYMSGFMAPYTVESKVDANTLDWIDEPKGSPLYKPGFVYILQNFGDAGINDLETLFHEGGHGTEKILKSKTDPTDEAYGYVEVPSMTSERFARDPLLLLKKAVPHNGQLPTLEEIQKLVRNDELNNVLDLIGMASTALYDLNLWDYDYSAPGAQTYLQRVESVNKEVDALAGNLPMIESPVPFHFWSVSTSHFVSGSVRNIGYTYAEIASRMMTKYLTDEIEKLSGRRTWYQQPQMASLFTERFFEQGWKTQFPLNIEQITGQKFSAEAVVADMAEQLKLTTCERKLM